MNIENTTQYDVDGMLREAVGEYPTKGITVQLKYCPKGSRRYISGKYYLANSGIEEG